VATSHSDTAFLTMEKSFTYRGQREHWSNAYHLDLVPANSAQWDALRATVWNLESPAFPANVQIEKTYGHNPGTPPTLVYEYDWPPAGEGGNAGTFAPTATMNQAPGDAAIFVRYGTTQKNSRGKPIYLWNYYHAVFFDDTAPDVQDAVQKGKFTTLANLMVAGINTGVSGVPIFHRAGPRGAVAQNYKVSDFITTRTLKHRGKHHQRLPAGTTITYPPYVTLN